MVRLIALIAAMIFSASAAAQVAAPLNQPTDCRVRINTAPSSWVIQGYDPFSGEIAEGTYSVTFVNDSAAQCSFTPKFQLQQPPFGLSKGSGRPVSYAILNLSEARDVTPRSGSTLRAPAGREIVLQPNESQSVLYKLVVDPGTVRDAGTFTQNVTIEAQDSQFRSFGGAQILLGLNVLPSARIGLAGAYTVTDGQALVNLGTLRQGVAPVPLQLRVSSTGSYDISVTSANSGRLRLGSSDWTVPYSIALGGNTVNLIGTQSVSGPAATGYRRDALPIQFIVGDVSNKRAGSYTDIVSISVTAR